jgi:spore coat polysaccharide biosynthesis predicted glycosyltransferase SpsG
MILRPEFAIAPDRPAAAPEVRRVLLMTGGVTPGPLVGELVSVVRAALPEALIDVVVGPYGSAPVRKPAWQGRVFVHHDPSDLRDLMLRADLAISAGGQTAYELAATMTPTLGIRLAENQMINLHGLSRAGCLVDLGAPEESGFHQRLGEALARAAGDVEARRRMGEQGRRLVDGQGASRVAQAVIALARQHPSHAGHPHGGTRCQVTRA